VGKKKFNPPAWLHGPVSVAIRSLISVPLVAGLRPSLEVAARAGRFYAGLRANRKRLDRAAEHLAVAFPGWNADRRRDVAAASYEHLFRLGVEVAYAPRLLSADGWPGHVSVLNVSHALAPLLERRPTLLITAHCGNWEIMGCTVAMLGFPMHAIYRPLDLAPLDRWVRATREGHGLALISKFGALKHVDDVVAARNPLAFVADQNGGDRGIFVPFFGRLASTYKSIGLLAMQHGATMICGTAHRAEPVSVHADMGYTAEVTDVFGPEDWNAQPDPLFYLTARYRRAIEAMVRRTPEQYLWMHRAWKSRPPHEKRDRPFPAALREKLRTLPWMTEEELARVEERSEQDRRGIAAGRVVA
jgi:KDO2-lipid IV(A) lauroyltransferase